MLQFTHGGERRYAQLRLLSKTPGLVHAFSTRPINMSPRPGPLFEERSAARERFIADFGLDRARAAWCVQVHTPKIARIDDSNLGPHDGFDGLITATPGVSLMVFSADCPLVLAFDSVAGVLGVVHSSWRCTVGFSTRLLIERMTRECGARADRIIAGIGPSAGPASYEVGEDVYAAAADLPDRDRLFPRREGRMYFDLWEANRRQLIDAGVPEPMVEIAGICTMEHVDTFFSYRREGAGCGNFALLAGIKR